MKISYAGCAILAPALASAAAFAMPEPTQQFAPAADDWNPAPTTAPQLELNLFAREVPENQGNTCGYVSGLSASSVTCPNSNAICATNTFRGVHGCCDPASLSSCNIATTCIPSTALSSLCTDASCSSDLEIAKCTAAASPECYKWLFAYASTTMTQHGCAPTGFTSTAQRSYGPSSTPTSSAIVVPTTTALYSPTLTPTSSPPADKKQSLGPIVGGTVGGCVIVSLVALAAFLIHRRRAASKSQAPPPTQSHFPHSSPEFNTNGFPTQAWTDQDIKTWQQSGGVYRPGLPHMSVHEVHGEDRAVEVEAPEKNKAGQWQIPGVGAVEIDGRGREKTGIVEAPT